MLMECLDKLTIGDRAEIISVSANGGVAPRLLAMGLLPGVTAEVTGVAPFGDPLTVKINGCSISLRRADAALVEAKKL